MPSSVLGEAMTTREQPRSGNRATDDLFRSAKPVSRSRVDQLDATLDRGTNCRDRLGVIRPATASRHVFPPMG